MGKSITIVYANRDRTPARINLSLESLANQTNKNFKVVFVDYGSKSSIQNELNELCEKFSFVEFYPLEVRQLLWNKSKALNYGILQSKTSFIFIADVDLIFHPETIESLNSLCDKNSFLLFKLGYLSKKDSLNIDSGFEFKKLKACRTGYVNGMVLASKDAFLNINGFDEFFHFYGAEDVDLFDRLERAGYKRNQQELDLFLHNWHPRVLADSKNRVTSVPGIRNIMRINQRHYLWNKLNNVIQPKGQSKMGSIISGDLARRLETPNQSFKISNVKAVLEHFLNEELKNLEGIISIVYYIDPYYGSLKYLLKKVFKTESQIYLSFKEMNDMVLKDILYKHRNANYMLSIDIELNKIDFRIELV